MKKFFSVLFVLVGIFALTAATPVVPTVEIPGEVVTPKTLSQLAGDYFAYYPKEKVYVLRKPVHFKCTGDVDLGDAQIVRNGNPFEISTLKTISSEGAVIRAFRENDKKAPDADQQQVTAGGKSQNGPTGATGPNGKSAGEFMLAADHIEGKMAVINDAQDGGNGGPGGNASPIGATGTSGDDYRAAKSTGDAGKVVQEAEKQWNKLTHHRGDPEAPVVQKERNSSPGGQGGPGGMPGPAGSGGNGGDASGLTLAAHSFDLDLTCSLKGGKKGKASKIYGSAGKPGPGGRGGLLADGKNREDSGDEGFRADDPRNGYNQLYMQEHNGQTVYDAILGGKFTKDGADGKSLDKIFVATKFPVDRNRIPVSINDQSDADDKAPGLRIHPIVDDNGPI